MRRAIILAALLTTSAWPAYAANIEVHSIEKGQLISIDGEIGPNDFDAFKVKASLASGRSVVFLNSPGGNVIAAIQIGEFIRLRGWATLVAKECSSACALIWLAGIERMMASNAKIGFHAASINGQEKGMGNAVVGAYLNRIGLGYQAVAFATQASPDEIVYLTPSDAKEVGIEVSVIPSDQQTAAAPPAPPPPMRILPSPPAAPRQNAVTYFPRKDWETFNTSNGRYIHRYLYAGNDGTYQLVAQDHDATGVSNGYSVCLFRVDGWSDCINNARDHYQLKAGSIKAFAGIAAQAPQLDAVATDAVWGKQFLETWAKNKEYYQQVRSDMAKLIESGQVPLINGMHDLDAAYNKAIEPITAQQNPWVASPNR